MVEGLLIQRHVLASMRIDVMCLQVVVIDETISLVGDVVVTVILETLAIEVFTKG